MVMMILFKTTTMATKVVLPNPQGWMLSCRCLSWSFAFSCVPSRGRRTPLVTVRVSLLRGIKLGPVYHRVTVKIKESHRCEVS